MSGAIASASATLLEETSGATPQAEEERPVAEAEVSMEAATASLGELTLDGDGGDEEASSSPGERVGNDKGTTVPASNVPEDTTVGIARDSAEDMRYVKEGEREYGWLPGDAVAGAPAWKVVVDRYYDEVLPKTPDLLFTHFIRRDFAAITMSERKDYTCVYTAVAKLMELQWSEMHLTNEMVADFEARDGFDCKAQRGLSADQIEKVFERLV
ncbi:Hypothetical protein PHPALM_16943 [Phytophthora palmivora]|uniref:Uncharacterized protein n=1 Tax=Phytophthora palmivora TaxID=4796 RepID=A0A2P4XNG8_9STRA|nr:Hypothetical protein PHPALM_16943 [Phytophthora palmivora]